ncbi:DUF5801 domain-containing protein [Synechococcus sp. A10-1-5-1]|uniref:DUF5801 repeats-in-toxin domain-containing protein n=1 Tax=Synechococcus sp. A10-1-5-1 TaxID=2936507 RepID=UPI00200108BC|nr:DUF5801 repeats-in-toxin domain-containing protein [Synechococcus sp. A10-1-5-1]UPM50766.1 DUF5801 domain-containing protein [Synechococcus sp. A10-1-5-1]
MRVWIYIRFGDDGPGNPTLTLSGTEPIALTFDGGLSGGNFVGVEGAGDTNGSPVVASVDFSGAFASGNLSDYGADGAGTGSVVTYELILDSAYTEGTPSGLTSGGVSIRLYESGGVITGSTSLTEVGVNAGNTAFTIVVNSSSGVLTLTQSKAIDHLQTDTYDGAYIEDLALLGNDLIELRATASGTFDSEGDVSTEASASLDLGGNIRFGDDGPGNPTLTLSGTEPIALTFDGGLSGGNFVGVEGAGDTNGSPVVASVDFSGAFASGNLSDYGADGAGTGSVVTYELILDSAYTEGTPSGLTSGGVSIRLYESGGVITGSTSLTEVGVNAGNTAFTIVVNSSSEC